jgi:diadenosine tetraphosphate (Ap4A) HIT family hydrolase
VANRRCCVRATRFGPKYHRAVPDLSVPDQSVPDQSVPGKPVPEECLACALSLGAIPLPGGLIHRTRYWLVEHCVGPLGVATLVVKPQRHVTAVADLTDAEALELGPLLKEASAVVSELVEADQVYNTLWSHAGGMPAHIHYVVQPVTKEQMATTGLYGPKLQTAMFVAGEAPDEHEIERVSEKARSLFAAG